MSFEIKKKNFFINIMGSTFFDLNKRRIGKLMDSPLLLIIAFIAKSISATDLIQYLLMIVKIAKFL